MAASASTTRSFITPFLLRFSAYIAAFVCGAAVMYVFRAGVVNTNSTTSPVANPSAEVHSLRDVPDDEPMLVPSPVEQPVLTQPEAPAAPSPPVEVPSKQMCVSGTTEPAPGRYAKLPLATNQAVAFVDVKPGDRVKKGWQVFSHWESPERLQAVKTELDKTRKMYDVSKSRWQAATQTLERLQKLQANVAAQELQDAQNNVAIRQGEMEAAELSVASAESHFTAMEFEFNQAFVTSPLDGIVASVDIHEGDRRQVGGPFRGVTVIDPRILSCRCFVDQTQLAVLHRLRQAIQSHSGGGAQDSKNVSSDSPSANAESTPGSSNTQLGAKILSEDREWSAVVTSIGILADPKTGLIPVILEVENRDETLPCGIRVNVCFDTESLDDHQRDAGE